MRYRVAFTKRYQADGTEATQDPTAELDVYLAEGVVAEKLFVERLEPAAQHNQEILDEDDAWLGMAAPEVWEYEVVNARQGEFEDAIRNSQMVLEFEIIDAGDTAPEDATAVALAEPPINPQGTGSSPTAAIDDLTVTDAADPRLGLTNIGDTPPLDWAANTGQTRNPERGVKSDRLADRASTLAPDRPRAKRPRKPARKSA
ncbi:MAG: hypothetical protein K2X35_20025 [Bryobacteraceae bacterium]|nr:hypothetical protein [Bryobacteraceae bacterium]